LKQRLVEEEKKNTELELNSEEIMINLTAIQIQTKVSDFTQE
jgi:hypothetical protein